MGRNTWTLDRRVVEAYRSAGKGNFSCPFWRWVYVTGNLVEALGALPKGARAERVEIARVLERCFRIMELESVDLVDGQKYFDSFVDAMKDVSERN